MIKIYIEYNHKEEELEIPEGINLSLMEVLKSAEYPIQATCGGMALCATCHVFILDGIEKLDPQGEEELQMLDSLPDSRYNSRLSCQIRINENLNGAKVRLAYE